MGPEEAVPEHRRELFRRLARKWGVPLPVLEEGYLGGRHIAPEICRLLVDPVKELAGYHGRGYEILTLGRDTLPLRYMLLRVHNVPTKTLGISSTTTEVHGYHLLTGLGLDRAYEEFKARYSREYERLKNALANLVKGERVVVVDTGYLGTHTYLVSRVLQELGKEVKSFLVFGVGSFPGRIYYKQQDPVEQYKKVMLVEAECIKPHLKYYAINRARSVNSVRDRWERIRAAKNFAGWLGFVDYVNKVLRRRRSKLVLDRG